VRIGSLFLRKRGEKSVKKKNRIFYFQLGKKRYPRGRKKVLISKCHFLSGLSAGEPEKKSFWGKNAFFGPGAGSAGGQILRISSENRTGNPVFLFWPRGPFFPKITNFQRKIPDSGKNQQEAASLSLD